jgi:hypothetical protein
VEKRGTKTVKDEVNKLIRINKVNKKLRWNWE